MRKRILVVTMFMMLVVLTACGGDKTSQTSGDNKGTDKAVETTGKQDGFWLTYGPKNLEKKDLSDLEFFNCYKDSDDLMTYLKNPNFTYYKIWVYSIGTSGEQIEGDNLEATLAQYSGMCNSGEACEIELYEEKDGEPIIISVYNLSGGEATLEDCITQNNFMIGDCNQVDETNYAIYSLGIENADDKNCNVDCYIKLGELLGKPDKIYGYPQGGEQTFDEKVKSGEGSISYIMMYQMNKGKLLVSVSECYSNDHPELNYIYRHILVGYCSSEELYTFLRDETNSGEVVHEEYEYNFEN